MELYHTAYGPEGAPPLLVLHGGPGASHDYMLPQMLELANEYRLIFYDQRGGGRSKDDADRSPITWKTHVTDLAALVRELQLEPLTLVGYSWGGLLALLYAVAAVGGFRDEGIVFTARDPAPVPARMVLITPAPATFDFRVQFSAELARRQREPWIADERAAIAASGLRERDPAAFAKRIFELGVAGYFANPARAAELTPFRVIARVQQSVWESLAGYDLTQKLNLVEAPTLVLHGAHDAISLGSSEMIAEALPNGELVVLDESAHVPYVEGKDAFFAAVRDFLQRTRAHP
ncbi:MAG: alpha/beta fold hydrolase [Gemmatimonadota bacterium]|nr:alpha/beta fold hydrolase [Gemmatimonadota bacterium]